MPSESLTENVSARICAHMNDKHKEAVLSLASHYGEVEGANQARMLSLSPESMRLEVDGEIIQIPFTQPLKDSGDAHHTLVRMIKEIPLIQ